MNFFNKVFDVFCDAAYAAAKRKQVIGEYSGRTATNQASAQGQSSGSAQGGAQDEEATLREYRSRGIYVLEVYVGGSFWSYFHYPSEEHRDYALNEFWPTFFRRLKVSFHCEVRDPR